MNMNLNLNFNPQALIKALKPFIPSLLGLAVVAIFGYAGWAINQAFNVKASTDSPAASPAAKITFDKQTVETVKNLRVVPGEVPPTATGKSDPFGN